MRKLILFLAAVSLVLFAEKALCYETTFSIEPESFNSFRYQEMRAEKAASLSIRTGRFLSVDPVHGDAYRPQTLNRYSYVSNNPVRYVDPTGQYFVPGYGGDAARDKGDPCILCNDSQKELRVSAEIIVNAAVKAKEKPKKYAFHEALDGFRGGPAGSDIGSYKCNKFVYDVMNESGATVLTNWRNNIPTAAQWADPSYAIGGWWVVKKPRAGDVAAIMLGSGTTDGATGHVGIVSDPVRGRTISAAHDGVVENDWGFRTGQTPTFRRFWSLMTLEERLCGCM